MSWAVIKTGGKQYRVKPGQVLRVEKLSGEPGTGVTFPEVLLWGDSDKIEIGRPLVSGMAVEGKIKAQAKGQKLIIFKFRPKKRYRVKTGHRQWYTEVEITKVGPSSVKVTEGKKGVEGKAIKAVEPLKAIKGSETKRSVTRPARKTPQKRVSRARTTAK